MSITEDIAGVRSATLSVIRAGKPALVSLRFRLRDATAADHARLDASLGKLDLREHGGYRRFLETNAAALLPLERALTEAGVNDIIPDWPSRARTDALLADLSRIGGDAKPLVCGDTFDRHAVFGALYVLEGSRLGARVLLPIVLGSDDLKVATTNAYLGHGLDKPLWQSFIKLLERHGETLDDDSGVIRGARLAFDLFAQAAARA